MRKQNWPISLNDIIEEYKNKPFVWGESDCLHFATRTAAAMIEKDIYAGGDSNLWQYNSEDGAAKVLADHFNGDMGNVFSMFFDEINPKMAGRGDIAIVQVFGKEICGVFDSTGRSVVCKAMAGVLFTPISKVTRAWRVD